MVQLNGLPRVPAAAQVKKSWSRSGAGFSYGWLTSWYLSNSMFVLLTGEPLPLPPPGVAAAAQDHGGPCACRDLLGRKAAAWCAPALPLSGVVLTANKHWTSTFQQSTKGIWTSSCEHQWMGPACSVAEHPGRLEGVRCRACLLEPVVVMACARIRGLDQPCSTPAPPVQPRTHMRAHISWLCE